MRSAIAWICDHALLITVSWFGIVAAGYAAVAVIWIYHGSNSDRLLGLAKLALPISGLGLSLVGAAAAIERLSPQARLNLHWLFAPTTSGLEVPILEIENRSSVEARDVELVAHISLRRRWPVDLSSLHRRGRAKPYREERYRVYEHLNSELFNHIEFWPTAEGDPVWKRPKRNVMYPDREVWVLDQPLAPGQRLKFEPRFEKSLRHQIVKADEPIEGIVFVASTSTGRRSAFKDTLLVSRIRAQGLS